MADETGRRHALRVTFDRSAELYDRARPVAPREVFDDLVALAGLSPGARLLESGCGSGQATKPLAERGFVITGIELGPRLAARARENLAGHPDVEIVTGAFEDWDPRGAAFDAVVSFNAFHWVDEDVRFSKPAAILREDGHLAVMGSSLVDHDGADPLWQALQEDYTAATGSLEERLHVDAMRDRSTEFEEGGYFGRATRSTYLWDVTYDAEAYVGLLRTMSSYTRLEESVREDLFGRIRDRIEASPTGTIRPTTAAVLYVAKRA